MTSEERFLRLEKIVTENRMCIELNQDGLVALGKAMKVIAEYVKRKKEEEKSSDG